MLPDKFSVVISKTKDKGKIYVFEKCKDKTNYRLIYPIEDFMFFSERYIQGYINTGLCSHPISMEGI